MPGGRLHAVGGDGPLTGRAVCSAPVIALDPDDWTGPDHGGGLAAVPKLCLR